MVKIYCNRCKKELDRNNKIGYIALNYRRSYLGDLVGDNQYEDMDFCTECMDALKAFLSETPAEHPARHNESVETASQSQESETDQPKELFREPKDGTLKPEGKKTRQRLDYGKIMALHNAGWSNAKIADEMGMTYAAVATAISTYKRKMKVGGGELLPVSKIAEIEGISYQNAYDKYVRHT